MSASSTTCSGSAEEVYDHRVEAAGLGDQPGDGPLTRGKSPVDGDAGFRPTGEGYAVHAAVANQSRADSLAAPGQKMQHVGRNACLMYEPHSARGDERRLLGGLSHHRVSRCQSARDLPGEDGEREVPGRDRREHAASVQRQLVQLSGRTLQHARSGKLAARFRRCIAEMVDGLAEVTLRVADGLAALPHEQRHEPHTLGLEQIGGAFENDGARLTAPQVPIGARSPRGVERAVDGSTVGGAADADDDTPVMRRGDPADLASRPRSPRPETIGLAAAGCARASCVDSSKGTRTVGSNSGRPRLFSRSGMKRSGGGGISGFAFAGNEAAFSTGSATMAEMGAASSASRFTNEVLAPFSKSRRTR